MSYLFLFMHVIPLDLCALSVFVFECLQIQFNCLNIQKYTWDVKDIFVLVFCSWDQLSSKGKGFICCQLRVDDFSNLNLSLYKCGRVTKYGFQNIKFRTKKIPRQFCDWLNQYCLSTRLRWSPAKRKSVTFNSNSSRVGTTQIRLGTKISPIYEYHTS